jgi:hypothetical protein
MFEANLTLLADHLGTLPAGYLHFDMETYLYDPRMLCDTERDEIMAAVEVPELYHGMVMCSLGHSARAGVITRDNIGNIRTWKDVARTFYGVEGAAFGFLFGGEWYVEDNTPEGASKRIFEYLANGVPEPHLYPVEDGMI